MELHELGAFINSFGGASLVSDGKIGHNNKFQYSVDYDKPRSGRIPQGVKYGVDYSYRELYRPIEEHVDMGWIDIVDEWLHEEMTRVMGYRRNK